MQNHGDAQRLSHGSRIVDSSQFKANINMTAWRGYMQIIGEIRCVYIQIISENISLSHGSLFQASEHFKMSHLKQAQVAKTLYKRQSILKNHNSTSRDQIKNQGTALFPEFIN